MHQLESPFSYVLQSITWNINTVTMSTWHMAFYKYRDKTQKVSLSHSLSGSCLGDTSSCISTATKAMPENPEFPPSGSHCVSCCHSEALRLTHICFQIKSWGNRTENHGMLSSKEAKFLSKPQLIKNLYLGFLEGHHKGKCYCLQLCSLSICDITKAYLNWATNSSWERWKSDYSTRALQLFVFIRIEHGN